MIWIALAAWGGGIVAGLLGWLKSREPFDTKKFGATFLRSLLAGGVFAVGSNFLDLGWPVLTTAFLAGAGVDAGLHRLNIK